MALPEFFVHLLCPRSSPFLLKFRIIPSGSGNSIEYIELAREFCREQFVARGMIVDLAVHEGKSKNEDEPDNPHFHVLAPIRAFTEDGSWGNKQKREYVLDEDGNRIKDARGKDIFNAVSNSAPLTINL